MANTAGQQNALIGSCYGQHRRFGKKVLGDDLTSYVKSYRELFARFSTLRANKILMIADELDGKNYKQQACTNAPNNMFLIFQNIFD